MVCTVGWEFVDYWLLVAGCWLLVAVMFDVRDHLSLIPYGIVGIVVVVSWVALAKKR